VTRLHLRGGRVLTPTGVVSDLVLEDGRVLWCGADAPPGDGGRTVDLAGRLVTPAFVDAHAHLAATGLALLGVDLGAARSAEEALHLLTAHARTSRLAVVLGHSWDETGWPDQRVFTRAELDAAVGGRPAYVGRVDVHSAFASTALVDAAGDLAGLDGWSDQGPLTRDAHHAVRDAQRRLLGPEDRAAALLLALQTAAARGLGLVHELGAPHISDPDDFATIERLRVEHARDGLVLPEVVGYWGELGSEGALDTVRELGCEGAAGDLCVDGSIGSRTAALEQPFAGGDGRGHLYLSADQVTDHVVACTEAGLQAGFHVIGDRAVAAVVAGLEQAADKLGADALRSARHRLEHVEMVSADQVAALARLGVTASVQPMFDGLWGAEGGLYDQRLGARHRGMNPFGTMHASGVPLAFGSDSPVTPFDPWAGVRAAVHHHDPRERLDVATALEAHTVGGWRAARRDDGGRLEPGARAHLAVWDLADGSASPDGLPSLDPDHPLPVCVLTLVDGAVAHDAGGLLT
jgi:predicted amidohydrolase YtcJ